MSLSKLPPPEQYQKGWTEFYKLKFKLTPDVLIPRPETELLVDEILNYTKVNQSTVSIIDVGTGSGCVAISVAKNLKDAKVFALDISEKALDIAKLNAKFHRVENRVLFFKSDLLSEINIAPDIIVANLPYIPTARLQFIDPLVTDFEPKIALDGGRDGFELYKRLFEQMKEKKLYPKLLIAEIDEAQGDLAKQVVRNLFPNAQYEVKQDLTKRDRILKITF